MPLPLLLCCISSLGQKDLLQAYNAIMTCLAAMGLSVDLQIIDNEASAEYKETITFKWNAKF
jgi:hypothetical protein